jgi:hypothetical protein
LAPNTRRHPQQALELGRLVAKVAVGRPVPADLLQRHQIGVLRANDSGDPTEIQHTLNIPALADVVAHQGQYLRHRPGMLTPLRVRPMH